MQIFQANTAQGAKRQAAETLHNLLVQYAEQSVLLLVSGGSMFEVLDAVPLSNDNQNVTVAVLDERYDTDSTINNFSQLLETGFFQTLEKTGVRSIDTRVQTGETLAGLVERFESALKQWKEQYPNGAVIAMQGIGADGHTAGILPHAQAEERIFLQRFDDPKRWVVGYDATGKNPYPLRVTTTLSFLRDVVDHSIVYAVGEAKREALEKAVAPTGSLTEIPARILLEMKQVLLITDIDLNSHKKIL